MINTVAAQQTEALVDYSRLFERLNMDHRQQPVPGNKPVRSRAPIHGRHRISQASQRVSATVAAAAVMPPISSDAASTQRESQATIASSQSMSQSTIRNADGSINDSDNYSQGFSSTPVTSQLSTGTVIFGGQRRLDGAVLRSFDSLSEIAVDEEEDDDDDGRRTVVPMSPAAQRGSEDAAASPPQHHEVAVAPTDTADEPSLESPMEEALTKLNEILIVFNRFTDSIDAKQKEDMSAWLREQIGTEFADACSMPIDRSEIIDDLEYELFSDLSAALRDVVFNARRPTAQNFTAFWDQLLDEQVDLPQVLAIFNVFIHGALQMDGSNAKEKKIGLQCATCFMLLVGISGRAPNDRMRQTWKLDKIAYESILSNCCQLAKCYKPTLKLQSKVANADATAAARQRRNNAAAADGADEAIQIDDESPAELSDLAATLYVCIIKSLEIFFPRSSSVGMNNVILRTALKVIEVYIRLLPPPATADKCAVAKSYAESAAFDRCVIGRDDAQTEQLFVSTFTSLAIVLRNSLGRIKTRNSDAAGPLLLHVQEDLKLKLMLIYLQMMPILTLLDENRKSYGSKLTAVVRKRSDAVAAFLLSVTSAYYAELLELDRRCEAIVPQNDSKKMKRGAGDAVEATQRKRSSRRLFLHIMMQMIVCSPDNKDARVHMNGIVMRFWRLFGKLNAAVDSDVVDDGENDARGSMCNEEQVCILMAYQQLACKMEVAARGAALEFATTLWHEPLLTIPPSTTLSVAALPFRSTHEFAKAVVCSGLQSPSFNLRSSALTLFKAFIAHACKVGSSASSHNNRDLVETLRNGYETAAEHAAISSGSNVQQQQHRFLPSLRFMFNQYLLPEINDANGRMRRQVLALVADVAAVEPSVINSVLVEILRERFRDPSVAVRRQVLATVEALLRNELLSRTSTTRKISAQQHVLAKLYLETVVKILFDSDQQTRELTLNSMESFMLTPLSTAKFRFVIAHSINAELPAAVGKSWLAEADVSTQLAWHMCCVVARDSSGDMLRCLEEAVDEWSKDRKGPKAKKVIQLNNLLMSATKWLTETTTQRQNSMLLDAAQHSTVDDSNFYTTAVSQELTVWCLLAMLSGYDVQKTLKCEVVLDFLFKNCSLLDDEVNVAESTAHVQRLPPIERNMILGHVLQFIIHKARSLSPQDAERYRSEMKACFGELTNSDTAGHICSAIRCTRALCEAASGKTQAYEYNDAADSRNLAENSSKNNKNKPLIDFEFYQWARRETHASFEAVARWLEASPLTASVGNDISFRLNSPHSSHAVKKHSSLPLPTVEQVVRALRALAEFLTHSIHLLKNTKKHLRNEKDLRDALSKNDSSDDTQYLAEIVAVMCHFGSSPASSLSQEQQQQQQQAKSGRAMSSRAPSAIFSNKLPISKRPSILTPELVAKYQRKVDECYEVRANALLALGRLCLLKKDWAVTYAPDYAAMLLDSNADDGLRCTCLQVMMDLYKRHSDTIERYLPRMTMCIGDANASSRLRETAVQNLQHMLKTDLLRYDGQFIFEVLAALPEAQSHRRATSLQQSTVEQQASYKQFSKSIETILITLSDNDAAKWLNIFLRAVLFFNGYTHHTKFDDALRAQVAATNMKQQGGASQYPTSTSSYVFQLAGDLNRKRRRIILQFMLLKMRDFSKLMLISRIMDELVLPASQSELLLDEALSSALIDIFELMSNEKNMRIAALDRKEQAGDELAQPGDAGAGGDAAAVMAELADDEQAEKRKVDEEKLKAQLEASLREISMRRVVPALAAFNAMVRTQSNLKLHRALLKYTKFVVESPMMFCKPTDFDDALLMTPGLERTHVVCFRLDLKRYTREVALREAQRPSRENDDDSDSGSDYDAEVKEENQLNNRPTSHEAAAASQQTRAERQKALDLQRRRTRTDLAQISLHERTIMGGRSLPVSAKKQQPQAVSPAASPGDEIQRSAGRQVLTPVPPSDADVAAASAVAASKSVPSSMQNAAAAEGINATTQEPMRRARRGRADADTESSSNAVFAAPSVVEPSAAKNKKKAVQTQRRRVIVEEDDGSEADYAAPSVTPTPSTGPNTSTVPSSSRAAKTHSDAAEVAESSRAVRRRNTDSTSGEDAVPQRAVSTPKRSSDAASATSSVAGAKKPKGAASTVNPDLTFNADISGIKNTTMRSTRGRFRR